MFNIPICSLYGRDRSSCMIIVYRWPGLLPILSAVPARLWPRSEPLWPHSLQDLSRPQPLIVQGMSIAIRFLHPFMNRLHVGTGMPSLLLEKYDGGPVMVESWARLRTGLYSPENLIPPMLWKKFPMVLYPIHPLSFNFCLRLLHLSTSHG
jgi:hypothetical protein